MLPNGHTKIPIHGCCCWVAKSFSRADNPQALCSSNLPKLLEQDALLFTAILGDLFPGKSAPQPTHDRLHRGLAASAEAMGLQPLTKQTTKVDQLHETMKVSSRL